LGRILEEGHGVVATQAVSVPCPATRTGREEIEMASETDGRETVLSMVVGVLVGIALIVAAAVVVVRLPLAGLAVGLALLPGGALACNKRRDPGVRRVGVAGILAGALALIFLAAAPICSLGGETSVPLFSLSF
jgi:hypothetical protein